MAHRVSQAVGEVAKRFGVAEFVQVKSDLHEPTPQELYVGRWQAEGDGEFGALELEANPNRAILYSMDRRSTRSCQWTTEEKTLVLTGLGPSKIRGNLDAEGHLVIVTANATTTLRKEE